MIFSIRDDSGNYATVVDTQRPNIHALAANSHAAVTQNTTRAIKVNHRRPLLLVAVLLEFNVFRFGGAVGKSHVLQFALAACVANGAIKRMVPEQQLDHALACLANLVGIGRNHHAVGDAGGTRSLELGHLLDSHQTHAACTLQRKIWVIAE